MSSEIQYNEIQYKQLAYQEDWCPQITFTSQSLALVMDRPGMNNQGMDHQVMGHQDYGTAAGALFCVLFFVVVGVWFAKKGIAPISTKRIDLFRIPLVERAVKSKYFSFLFRLIPALLFLLALATGFFGRTNANLAAPFTWLFWWTLLIFFVAFGGKIFCAACPWDFFANLFQFGWFHKVKSAALGLNLKWPKALANTYLAVIFFIVFIWLELGAGLMRDSYWTAMLGLAIVCIAILSALVFEKRAFCRYACPIGRISGIYAQFSPLELRYKDLQVCKDCRTKDCIKGGEHSTPCPTSEIPFKLEQNTYCTLCTECIRSCEKDNLTIKLRPPAYDLQNVSTYRFDESLLIYVILALTFFHGLTMTPMWVEWTETLGRSLNLSYTPVFTILMSVIFIGAFLIFYMFEKLVGLFLGEKGLSLNLVYAFIPLALGYHLGHNTMHMMGEIGYLVPLISDPFGWGWNLLGLNNFQPGPLSGHGVMVIAQLTAICIGFYYSVKILRIRSLKLAKAIFPAPEAKSGALYASHFVLMLIIGLLGVWFVFQPMAMRGSY